MSAAAVLTAPTDAERRAAWLEDRRRAITGTDLAAILGLSPWKSPMAVYLEKKGLAPDPHLERMRWGQRLEHVILEGYAEETGQAIEFQDPYHLHRHPELPILGVSLDGRLAAGDRRPVDAKNIRWKTDDWGDPGTDVVPIYYAAQVMLQAMVLGTPCGDLAPLFSGQQLERFTVWVDPDTRDMILTKAAAWWERHIVQDNPPEMDGSEATAKFLARRFRKHTEALITPTEDLRQTVASLCRIRTQAKALESEQGRLENILKAAIGEAAGIQGLATWKAAKDSEKVDWEALARHLAARLAINCNAYRDVADVMATFQPEFTTTKPGSRRFLLTMKEATR